MVDARDFVDGYIVMMKNGGRELIKVEFVDTQSLEERDRGDSCSRGGIGGWTSMSWWPPMFRL